MSANLAAHDEGPRLKKWPSFNWEDTFLFEDQLTEEEKLVRDSARAFAEERLMPGIQEANRLETFDPTIISEMGKLGLLGSTLPEEYGCAGASYVVYGLIAREVERVDSAYRSQLFPCNPVS